MPTIKNTSRKVIRVAGHSIPPGRLANIPANHYHSWIRQADQNALTASLHLEVVDPVDAMDARVNPEETLPPMDPGELRRQRIYNAIGNLGESAFNRDGLPNMGRLKTMAGLDDITDEERRDIWAEYQASEGLNEEPDAEEQGEAEEAEEADEEPDDEEA